MLKLINISFLLILMACVPQTKKQAIDLKIEGQAIRSLSMKWLELDRAKDADGQAALFTRDGMVIRENEEPIVGTIAIREYMIRYYGQYPNVIPDWVTDSVEVAASGDLAVEYGSWTEKDGVSTVTEVDHGKYITIYHKGNGEWKVAADISVSTKPEILSK
jgi:ketosteroid isomerase-like protein